MICRIIDLSCRIISLENAAEFPIFFPQPIRSPDSRSLFLQALTYLCTDNITHFAHETKPNDVNRVLDTVG